MSYLGRFDKISIDAEYKHTQTGREKSNNLFLVYDQLKNRFLQLLKVTDVYSKFYGVAIALSSKPNKIDAVKGLNPL